MISVAFISVGEYAFIVAVFDILFREVIVSGREQKNKDISLTCLFLGSHSALNDEKSSDRWVNFNLH